ncbi:MAG: hypothetical protein GXN98_04835, partial [Euryarchaeota archaeon]|nr:hypothetical protein [Euryarchaeota archaeon]
MSVKSITKLGVVLEGELPALQRALAELREAEGIVVRATKLSDRWIQLVTAEERDARR